MSDHAPNTLAHLGEYRVVRALTGDQTLLAEAHGHRLVVLKMLPEDCLARGRLHPAIHDRLARVRELPEKSTANLHGVERDGSLVYCVWDYVPGRTLADTDVARGLSARECLMLARELTLAVESLHGTGIVHGAIKPGNVVLGDEGSIRLTHISPLLYSDPQQDVQALVRLLWDLVEQRGETDQPLGRVLDEARIQGLSLRQLSARLSDPNATRDAPQARRTGRAVDARIRKRSIGAAMIVLGLALAAAVGVWWYASHREAGPVPLENLPTVELDRP